MVQLDNRGFLSLSRCYTAGSWTTGTAWVDISANNVGLVLQALDTSTYTTWNFMTSGAVIGGRYGTTNPIYLLGVTQDTNRVGELAWTNYAGGGQVLPARGTWFVMRAISGDTVGIYAGGTNLAFNYQAIRIA
jgi:hypothetical protein